MPPPRWASSSDLWSALSRAPLWPTSTRTAPTVGGPQCSWVLLTWAGTQHCCGVPWAPHPPQPMALSPLPPSRPRCCSRRLHPPLPGERGRHGRPGIHRAAQVPHGGERCFEGPGARTVRGSSGGACLVCADGARPLCALSSRPPYPAPTSDAPLPPPPQGDRLSLAGTSWTRMTNSWGSKWELS